MTGRSAHPAPGQPAAGAVRVVPCPTCGGDSVFAPSNPYRPFCSLRCRQIDLGAWASESFRVPTQQRDDEPLGDPQRD